jgi:ABC-type bacteriocin/lantibiotic exporter with double-glycine peptidase domain
VLPHESQYQRKSSDGTADKTWGIANPSSLQGEALSEKNELSGKLKTPFQIAQIHDHIESLPDKYNTLCGQRGSSLSGGQQQRLVIARALLRQPDLLLLDEATSALDAETEDAVVSALDRWKSETGATLLIITHRIRAIKHCDAAIILHQGTVSN